MKILCGKCKEEMTDHSTYIQCQSGKCDVATSSHAIVLSESALVKYQISGDIIILGEGKK